MTLSEQNTSETNKKFLFVSLVFNYLNLLTGFNTHPR